MSTTALNGLFEYITNTLTEEELIWLTTELSSVTSAPKRHSKPYTLEELNARIDESEQQIAAEECCSTDEVFHRIYGKYQKTQAEQQKESMTV